MTDAAMSDDLMEDQVPANSTNPDAGNVHERRFVLKVNVTNKHRGDVINRRLASIEQEVENIIFPLEQLARVTDAGVREQAQMPFRESLLTLVYWLRDIAAKHQDLTSVGNGLPAALERIQKHSPGFETLLKSTRENFKQAGFDFFNTFEPPDDPSHDVYLNDELRPEDAQDLQSKIQFIQQEHDSVVQELTIRGIATIPPYTEAATAVAESKDTRSNKHLYDRLYWFFQWLERLELWTSAKSDNILEQTLTMMFEESHHFPDWVKRFAGECYERFLDAGWGDPDDEGRWMPESPMETPAFLDSHDSLGRPLLPKRTAQDSAAKQQKRQGQVEKPPPLHPSWGRNTIMHGLALQHGSHTVKTSNPDFAPRSAKVFGHNGIKVGQWFPKCASAYLYGATGNNQVGVTGSSKEGAYAVVVSGQYEDVNDDRGEVIFYAATTGDKHTDRNNEASHPGAKALHASYKRQLDRKNPRPVRVIRGEKVGKKQHSIAPAFGYRYDGLYMVVGKEYRFNKHGGMYALFTLKRVRADDQDWGMDWKSLDECIKHPDAAEKVAWEAADEVKDFNWQVDEEMEEGD